MRVTAQILEHLLRATERGLRVDHPIGVPKRIHILPESLGIEQVSQDSRQLEFALAEQLFQSLEKTVAEESRQDFDWQEEPRKASYPAIMIGTDAAAGDDIVDMGMVQQVLPPGMQNAEKADLGA